MCRYITYSETLGSVIKAVVKVVVALVVVVPNLSCVQEVMDVY